MAKYEVMIKSSNPFELPFVRQARMEVEADSEEQVKTFWDEAKSLPKYKGMMLHKINLLSG